MNHSSKSTIDFCIQFIEGHFTDASQITSCRSWLKTCIDTIKKEQLGSEYFIISELEAIDAYLSGANSKLTSADIYTKLNTVKQILG